MATVSPAVAIRLVASHEEFAACEAMSRDIWGGAERNVVPRDLLLTMQQNGGLVHGAFLPSGRMIGFCFGFPGVRKRPRTWPSADRSTDPVGQNRTALGAQRHAAAKGGTTTGTPPSRSCVRRRDAAVRRR